jgi:hypothetical protein
MAEISLNPALSGPLLWRRLPHLGLVAVASRVRIAAEYRDRFRSVGTIAIPRLHE